MFIYRDALLPSRMKLNGMHTIHNRMRKVWPTETVNGVKVYSERFYFYRNKQWIRTKSMERFFTSLGIELEEFYSQQIDDEIDDVWFYLDPEYQWDGSYAGDSRYGSYTPINTFRPRAVDIVDAFNEALEVGKEYKVTVQYGGPTKRYLEKHNLEWFINETGIIESGPLDTVAIRQQIDSDPWFYLANARNISTGSTEQFQLYDGGHINTPHWPFKPNNMLTGSCMVSTTFEDHMKPPGAVDEPLYELAAFAPMGNGVFTRIDNSIDENVSTYNSVRYDGEIVTYEYTYTYVYNGIDENSQLVQDILKYYDTTKQFNFNRRPNPVKNPINKYDFMSTMIDDTIYKRTLKKLRKYIDPYTGVTVRGYTDSLWYAGKLRYDEARLMRRTDFVAMLGTCLDTDYEVEEASVWEKIFAVILVLIAIVVFVYTLGSGSGISAMLVAQAAGYASIILSIGAFMLSAIGGLSTGELVEFIGAFAQIIGLIAMIAGVFAALDNAGRIMAEQALKDAGKQVTAEAVKNEMLQQTILDQMSGLLEQTLDSALGSVTDFVNMSLDEMISTISDGLDMIMKGLEFQQDKERESLQREYEALEEQNRQYELETLNNALKSPAEVWIATEDRITSYDALTVLNYELNKATGMDSSFVAWYTNVNSV